MGYDSLRQIAWGALWQWFSWTMSIIYAESWCCESWEVQAGWCQKASNMAPRFRVSASVAPTAASLPTMVQPTASAALDAAGFRCRCMRWTGKARIESIPNVERSVVILKQNVALCGEEQEGEENILMLAKFNCVPPHWLFSQGPELFCKEHPTRLSPIAKANRSFGNDWTESLKRTIIFRICVEVQCCQENPNIPLEYTPGIIKPPKEMNSESLSVGWGSWVCSRGMLDFCFSFRMLVWISGI